MSESRRSSVSRTLSEPPSPSFSSTFAETMGTWTTMSSLVVPPLPKASSSTPERFSAPSTKPPVSSGTAELDDQPYRVKLHRAVEKIVAKYGVDSDVFRPKIEDLIDALGADPKQFPKKKGRLRDARAADVRFADGITWRAVFVVDENTMTVKMLSLAPHDVAYAEAERRV